MGPGGPNMQQLMRQAQKMQQELMATQAALAEEKIEGTAASGAVVAVVSGMGDLLSLTIDPSVVDSDDTETLADLILVAIRVATVKAKERAEDVLGPLSQGMGNLGF